MVSPYMKCRFSSTFVVVMAIIVPDGQHELACCSSLNAAVYVLHLLVLKAQ